MDDLDGRRAGRSAAINRDAVSGGNRGEVAAGTTTTKTTMMMTVRVSCYGRRRVVCQSCCPSSTRTKVAGAEVARRMRKYTIRMDETAVEAVGRTEAEVTLRHDTTTPRRPTSSSTTRSCDTSASPRLLPYLRSLHRRREKEEEEAEEVAEVEEAGGTVLQVQERPLRFRTPPPPPTPPLPLQRRLFVKLLRPPRALRLGTRRRDNWRSRGNPR